MFSSEQNVCQSKESVLALANWIFSTEGLLLVFETHHFRTLCFWPEVTVQVSLLPHWERWL